MEKTGIFYPLSLTYWIVFTHSQTADNLNMMADNIAQKLIFNEFSILQQKNHSGTVLATLEAQANTNFQTKENFQ